MDNTSSLVAGLKYYSDVRLNVNLKETVYQYSEVFYFYLEANIHLCFF